MWAFITRLGIGVLGIFGLESVVATNTTESGSTGIFSGITDAVRNIWNSVFGGFSSIATIIVFVLIGILLIRLFKK